MHVYGWAIDPNTPEPIDVHVYIGGPAGSNAESFALRADVARTDVAATYGSVSYTHLDVYKRQVPASALVRV